MNLLYDTYIYKLQKAGGINRYICEIISRLPASVHPFIFEKIDSNIFAPQNNALKFFWLPKQLSLSPTLLRKRLRSMDLIHPSYYHLTPPLTWENIPGKVVITVHDFIMARFADRWPKSSRVISCQTAAIQRADHIICVSQATHADLLERFPESASRSSVIPRASSLPLPPPLAKNPYQQRYFMYVGARTFYKNFHLSLQTFARLKKKYADIRLAVVGGPWNGEEQQQMNELGVSDSVDLFEHPEDSTLGVLYQYAVALFYPSEFEGFGLPPLEAMQMGTPVIALKTSSLPEVIGPGGILIEPHEASPMVLAEAAASLLDSEEERHQLSLQALQQASLFSWDRTMKKTLQVYQKFQ